MSESTPAPAFVSPTPNSVLRRALVWGVRRRSDGRRRRCHRLRPDLRCRSGSWSALLGGALALLLMGITIVTILIANRYASAPTSSASTSAS